MGRLGTAPSLFSAALQHAAMLNDEPTTRLDAENVPFVPHVAVLRDQDVFIHEALWLNG